MSQTEYDVPTAADAPKPQEIDADVRLEENVMRYYLMPSLQHISAVNIAIALWRQDDVQNQIKKVSEEYGYYLPLSDMFEIWDNINVEISNVVSRFPVPNRIRKILSNVVLPIGSEISQWIRVNENIFSDDHTWLPYLISINCMDALVWTSRGRIDYKETARNLLDTKQLSNDEQYALACTYCLEDDLAIIAPKVIHTLDITTLEERGLLYIWTRHITGGFPEKVKHINLYNEKHRTDISLNECLFEELVRIKANHVAVKYFWDKLSAKEKSRQIVEAFAKIRSVDLKFFLISQMNKEQQQEVFETSAKKILLILLFDWLWAQYFLPTIHKMWNVISGQHYLDVLEAIVYDMDENKQDIIKYDHYRAIIKEVWKCAPKHLKEYVIELDNGLKIRRIFFRLFYEKNVDIIQLLLLDSNYIQKKKLFSGVGAKECYWLIAENQWDLFEMLIERTLVSEDDVNHCKQKLVNEAGLCTAVSFILIKEWNKVERFEKWAFKSDDEIKDFRQGLSYSTICRDLLESFVSNDNGDFTELEHFVDWCSLGDEEAVMRHKAKIPQLHFVEVICNLIEKDKYELLEKILNWCFVNNQKKIDKFKQNICHDHESFEILVLVVNLIKRDDHLQSLVSFVRWCITKKQEINEFKGWILHHLQGTVGVCIALLRQGLFQLADEFVNWCCNSSRAVIDDFKNELLCCEDIIDVFKHYRHNNKMMAEAISWFNPSNETLSKFQEKHMSVDWFKDFLPAIYNYVQEHTFART